MMRKEILTVVALAAFSLLFLSFEAGDISTHFTGDENFYFKSAEAMVTGGDWLTPSYFGKPRFQKPILFYWFVALSFKALGVGWFAARFPSVVFACMTVLLVYLAGRRFFKEGSPSLVAPLALLTTFKFFKYSRFAIPDMALLFFVTLSLYIFIKLIEAGEEKGFLPGALFLSLGLATMIKGPIGPVIFLLSVISYRVFSREAIGLRKRDIVVGVLLYLGLTLPWFITIFNIHGADYVSRVWAREIANRVSYASGAVEGAPVLAGYLGSLFFYIPIIIVRFLPWSLFLPAGILAGGRAIRAGSGEKRLHILILSWFFAVFFLFSLLGEKHSQYMLALSAPFALIVAAAFNGWARTRMKALALPFTIALVTASVFMYSSAGGELRLNSAVMASFAARITEHGLGKNDRIAVGSHALIPQQLEVYMERPVEKLGGRWHEPAYHERENKRALEQFFQKTGRAYCVISADDYRHFLSNARRRRLEIIYRDRLWNRKIELTGERLSILFKEGLSIFLDSFKKEYYLVVSE